MFVFDICWQTKGEEPRILGVTIASTATVLPVVGDFVSATLTRKDITHSGVVIMREIDLNSVPPSYCLTVEV